ncbi:MAG: hypothetical protein MAG794_01325 [Gammaproteobacteria bacterium]|nr:hypothetical protein [Gammaproteobacteria bacterium]
MPDSSDSDHRYLQPGDFVNSDDPAVVAFTRETAGAATRDVPRVLRLFYRIRDEILYDPYLPLGERSSYTAVDCLKNARGWCVPKAALLAACARGMGIPARCGYADVKNHLATRKLLDAIGTDIFYWHSYCDLYLNGRWVKATPAFNKSLCDRFHLKPLDFDGINDSLFHEFDQSGNRHMEYLHYRGTYADVPFTEIVATFRDKYKGLEARMRDGLDGDFQAEAGSG